MKFNFFIPKDDFLDASKNRTKSICLYYKKKKLLKCSSF
jgi:hypothetical protein